jgi:pseudouridine kinase
MPTICAVGSVAIDIKARMARLALVTTDVPGRVTLTPGGVSRNIAENLARLGAEAIFIGVVGDDTPARTVIEYTRAAGVDVRPIFRPDMPTAALAVTLDVDGRQIAGVFSGDILNSLTPDDLRPHLDTIRAADALVTDAGTPELSLTYLAGVARPSSFFYCNPASVALAGRMSSILRRCDLVTCNHLEAEALTGTQIRSEADALQAAGELIARGAQRAVVTQGSQGIAYADAALRIHRAPWPARIVDATGAGDALAAALIFALLRGDSIEDALSLGLIAASITCEAETSVSTAVSLDALLRRKA